MQATQARACQSSEIILDPTTHRAQTDIQASAAAAAAATTAAAAAENRIRINAENRIRINTQNRINRINAEIAEIAEIAENIVDAADIENVYKINRVTGEEIAILKFLTLLNTAFKHSVSATLSFSYVYVSF